MRFAPLGAIVVLAGILPAAGGEPLRSLRPAVVELRTAALVLSGQEGGSIPLAALVFEWPLTDGANVTALVEIEAPAPAARPEAPASGEIEVFVYALAAAAPGEEPEVLDLVTGVLRVERARLAEVGMTVLVPLRLPPGEHLLRVLVLDGAEIGLASAVVRVAGAGAVATPQLLVAAERPRLVARLTREAPAEAAGAIDLPPPFGVGERPRLPAARPRLEAGEDFRVHLLAAPADEAGPASARWRPARGGDLRETPIAVERRGTAAGVGTAELSLTAPETAGAYELTAAFGVGEGAGARITAPLAVDVVPGPGSAPVTAGAATTGAAAAEPPSAIDPGAVSSLAEGYREVLRRLATGDPATPAALGAFEAAAVERLGATALGALEQAQLGSFRDLDAGDWAAVLPVLELHRQAVRHYREDRRLDLAQHATRVAATLAAAYAERLDTTWARREAAWTLVALAELYRRRGPLAQAEELFARALEIDAGAEGALLGLAALHEKQGRFAAAAELLERLVERRPRHHEARLRLAVNLHRRGEVERARRLWQSLARSSAPDWIALVAFQELARSQLDRGLVAAAEETLRRGLERWLAQPTLTIQLAHLQDLRGEPAASRRLLAGLDGLPSRRADSARTRYNRWPDLELEEVRRELAERADERRPRLAEIVASDGGGG